MGERCCVVVTDVATPEQHLRCLDEVVRTVPGQVDVVAVSSRATPLTPALAARVRWVRAAPADLDAAVADEVRCDALVVVVRSDCRFQDGWFEHVQELTDENPLTVVRLPMDPAPVAAYSLLVRSTDAPQVQVPSIRGIDLPDEAAVDRPGTGARCDVTVSASMIVKDEESVISQCVRAVLPFVDEVVVYDTGSSDDTVARARAAGATVIQGYWDDSFGRARNRALEHCRGDWVLVVDADETVEGDPAAVRAWLTAQSADLTQATLINATWSGATTGQPMQVIRFFRPARGQWWGDLHERVVAREPGSRLTVADQVAPLRLMHRGYAPGVVALRDKAERNLRLASAAIQAGDDSGDAWSNYGRALAQAKNHGAALDALRKVVDRQADDTVHLLTARTAMQCLDASAHPGEDAELWIGVLERHGESDGAVTVHRARLAMATGDLDLAEVLLSSVPDGTDVWGVRCDPAEAQFARVLLLGHQDRPDQAWAAMVDLAAAYPDRVPLDRLLALAQRAGRTCPEVVAVVPPELVERSLRACLGLHPDDADQWLDAVWSATTSMAVVVTAGFLAPHLVFERVLEWELRAMQVGMPADDGPLAALSRSAVASVPDRVLAAAVRWQVQSRPAAEQDFWSLFGSLDLQDVAPTVQRLAEQTPDAAAAARQVVARER